MCPFIPASTTVSYLNQKIKHINYDREIGQRDRQCWGFYSPWASTPLHYPRKDSLISQMIKGCKEKFFINQIFDENIRRLHQGKKLFGKKMQKKSIFLPKSFFPWWRRLIFSSKIWLIKNFSLQPFIIWLINMIPRILIFATIKKRFFASAKYELNQNPNLPLPLIPGAHYLDDSMAA